MLPPCPLAPPENREKMAKALKFRRFLVIFLAIFVNFFNPEHVFWRLPP